MAHYVIPSPPDLWAKFAQSIKSTTDTIRQRAVQNEQLNMQRNLTNAQVAAYRQQVNASKFNIKSQVVNKALSLLSDGLSVKGAETLLAKMGVSADDIQSLDTLLNDPYFKELATYNKKTRALKIAQFKEILKRTTAEIAHMKNIDETARNSLALQAAALAANYMIGAERNRLTEMSNNERKRMDTLTIQLGTAKASLEYYLGVASKGLQLGGPGKGYGNPADTVRKALGNLLAAKTTLEKSRKAGLIDETTEKAILTDFADATTVGLNQIGIFIQKNPKLPFIGKLTVEASKLFHTVSGIVTGLVGKGLEVYGEKTNSKAADIAGAFWQDYSARSKAAADRDSAIQKNNNGQYTINTSTRPAFLQRRAQDNVALDLYPTSDLPFLLEQIGKVNEGITNSGNPNSASATQPTPNSFGSTNGSK